VPKKGYVFEEFVKEFLDMLRCPHSMQKVRRKGGGDIDLVLLFYDDPTKYELPFLNEIVIVEAKNYKDKIKTNVIDGFKTRLRESGSKAGIIITTSDFSKNAYKAAAKALANDVRVLLVNSNLIRKVLYEGKTVEHILKLAYEELLSFV